MAGTVIVCVEVVNLIEKIIKKKIIKKSKNHKKNKNHKKIKNHKKNRVEFTGQDKWW